MISERYFAMINNWFVLKLRQKRLPIGRVWCQQDGTKAHIARASMAIVRSLRGDHLISRFADNSWPSWSRDLSRRDYFFVRTI